MTYRPWHRLIGLLLITAQLVGCAAQVQTLKRHGVEFHSGKVVRVFRF